MLDKFNLSCYNKSTKKRKKENKMTVALSVMLASSFAMLGYGLKKKHAVTMIISAIQLFATCIAFRVM